MEMIKKLLRMRKDLLAWGTPKEALDLIIDQVKKDEGFTTQDINLFLAEAEG